LTPGRRSAAATYGLAMTEPIGPAPLVTVRGEAQLEGPPDLATVALTLHASGDSPERTRSQLAEGSAKVAELLRQFEASLERSSTTGVHVFPVFNRRTPPRITGYQGTFSTQIVVADLEWLSPLVLALTALPNSQVDGPWWSLRPDNPMYREARLAAIADARRRADDYAAAFGTTLADLVEVSDLNTGFGGVREMRAFAMAKGAEDAAFEFEPATQSVSGQVSVRFSLKSVSL
jgi:uncharacterized protein